MENLIISTFLCISKWLQSVFNDVLFPSLSVFLPIIFRCVCGLGHFYVPIRNIQFHKTCFSQSQNMGNKENINYIFLQMWDIIPVNQITICSMFRQNRI